MWIISRRSLCCCYASEIRQTGLSVKVTSSKSYDKQQPLGIEMRIPHHFVWISAACQRIAMCQRVTDHVNNQVRIDLDQYASIDSDQSWHFCDMSIDIRCGSAFAACVICLIIFLVPLIVDGWRCSRSVEMRKLRMALVGFFTNIFTKQIQSARVD